MMTRFKLFYFVFLLIVSCRTGTQIETPKVNEIKRQQNALITELSSTKCGACGEFGRESFDLALKDDENIIGLNIHVGRSELLVPDLYSKYESFYSVSATPTFVVNNEKVNITNNIKTNGATLKNKAKQVFNKEALANTKIEIVSINNNYITVRTSTAFFESIEPNSEYVLNVVLTENSIGVNQDNHNSNPNPYVVLSHVLRANFTEVSGLSLLNPTKDKIIENEFVQAIKPEWKVKDLNVLAIIYKRLLNPKWTEGSQNIEKYVYEFVNVDRI